MIRPMPGSWQLNRPVIDQAPVTLHARRALKHHRTVAWATNHSADEPESPLLSDQLGSWNSLKHRTPGRHTPIAADIPDSVVENTHVVISNAGCSQPGHSAPRCQALHTGQAMYCAASYSTQGEAGSRAVRCRTVRYASAAAGMQSV
jgi:hypothetical protein